MCLVAGRKAGSRVRGKTRQERAQPVLRLNYTGNVQGALVQ